MVIGMAHMQDYLAKINIGSISGYWMLKLMHLDVVNKLTKMIQDFLPSLVGTFGSTMLPFASVSNSLNKPTPLGLDVSLPSFQYLKWTLARLLYLFNIQLERNVAT